MTHKLILPIIDSREAVADHSGPRLATAAVVPYGGKLVPVVPVPIDGGNVVPRLDSREGGADHRPGCAVLPCCR